MTEIQDSYTGWIMITGCPNISKFLLNAIKNAYFNWQDGRVVMACGKPLLFDLKLSLLLTPWLDSSCLLAWLSQCIFSWEKSRVGSNPTLVIDFLVLSLLGYLSCIACSHGNLSWLLHISDNMLYALLLCYVLEVTSEKATEPTMFPLDQAI